MKSEDDCFGRKAMTNLDKCIDKERHCSADKGPYSQSYGLPSGHVWLWESWTVKKTEHWRVDAFELCCWRRLLKVPWTASRSNQSILREMNIHWKDCCWSWNSSIVVIFCKQMTHWKRPWCWERSRAEGEEDVRGWDGWTESPMQWTWTQANSGRWWGTGSPGVL